MTLEVIISIYVIFAAVGLVGVYIAYGIDHIEFDLKHYFYVILWPLTGALLLLYYLILLPYNLWKDLGNHRRRNE